MRIVISGASGLVGTALASLLRARGHRVDRLVRRPPDPGMTDVRWDPPSGAIDATALEGADAVVHLAGESIAAARWTPAKKRAIRESRTQGTAVLAGALARLRRPPRVLVSASAVGYYGDRGDEPLTEASAPGRGFLADVARAWEAAADPARQAGIRVVHPRIGVVLAAHGGALAKLLLPFKLGLGGVVGNGRQYWSWIALEDLISAIHHLLVTDALGGPVNATAPRPVTNREFTAALGRVLGRPTILPLPAPLVRVCLGDMGQALLLDSARVLPARLEGSGFRFGHPDLDGALRALLGRP